jgi:uncharacterized protein YbjT (DUF2867 family)
VYAAEGKVLVLGGTGFVGTEVCKQALQAGYDVVALSRRGVPEVSGWMLCVLLCVALVLCCQLC